jgi:hypothetical protein
MGHELMVALFSAGCRARAIQGGEMLTDEIAPGMAQLLEAFILLRAFLTQW